MPLEGMSRAYVKYEQDDWDQHLTAEEIATKNTERSSISILFKLQETSRIT